jgi:acyl carrier protein
MNENLEKEVRKFLETEFPSFADKLTAMPRDASLIAAGILDSLGLLNVVTFVESKWQLKVAPKDFVPELFESIVSIANFVQVHRGVCADAGEDALAVGSAS